METTPNFYPSRPDDPGRREKSYLISIFKLLCDTSRGFKKTLKTFIKPSEACQKIKIQLIFILTQLSEIHEVGRLKKDLEGRTLFQGTLFFLLISSVLKDMID